MKLRDYQQECISAIISSRSEKRALVVLPTASGKTVIFAHYVRKVREHNGKVLILVQKNILVEQTTKALNAVYVQVGIFNAGLGKKELKDCTVASIQSISKLDRLPDFDVVILDECHRYKINDNKSHIRRLIRKLTNPFVIGFTATPFEGQNIIYGPNMFFEKITYHRKILDMIDEGYLVPLKYFSEPKETKIDTSKVKKRGKEFIASDLERCIMQNKDKIVAQVNDALSRSVGHKKIIALTTSIAHAEFVYSLLDDAVLVHSKQSKKERKEMMSAYIDGSARILVSVLIASEGFDHPETTMIWFMRPTRSPTLYIQGAGRVLRPCVNKDFAVMLDYGEIVKELGGVTHAFDNVGRLNKEDEVEICIECNAYNRKGVIKCSECGSAFYSICGYCAKTFPRGTKCCVVKKQKEDLSSTKNLTTKAYEGDANRWFKVDKMIVRNHEPPSGNQCIAVDYFSGITKILTEYHVTRGNAFMRNKTVKFLLDHGCDVNSIKSVDDINKQIQPPKEIYVVKEGKYKKIQSRKL